MNRKSIYAALFIAAILTFSFSVLLMPGCSSGTTVNNDNVIQGTVTDAETGSKLEGVSITVGDKNTTTDSDGHYELIGFTGGRHTLKAAKSGYSNYSQEIIVSSWQTDFNFSMSKPTGETIVSGTVTDGPWRPVGVEGVTVNLGGMTTTTDSEGKYEFKGVEVKNMTLTATKDEYSDYSADIDVEDGNTTTHNFYMFLKSDSILPFTSEAGNLTTLTPIPSISLYPPQIYVHRKKTGETELTSLMLPGTPVPGIAYDQDISANGRYVLFNYLPFWGFPGAERTGVTPGVKDFTDIPGIYVYDRLEGKINLISKSSQGVAAFEMTYSNPLMSISADGRYVVFYSWDDNLVPDDDNGDSDVYIHDRENSTTKRISVNGEGVQGNDDSLYSAISADGRYCVFISGATNLVEGIDSGYANVYRYDQVSGSLEVVSVNNNGEQPNADCEYCYVSADGRYVVFFSEATNLVSGYTLPSSTYQVYLRDMVEGTTKLISVNSSDEPGDQDSLIPSVTADGRYVVFSSYASNFDPAASNTEIRQLFIHDVTTGETKLLSKSSGGEAGDDDTWVSKISADGSIIIFDSSASNLVANDTNASNDCFIYYTDTGVIERYSVNSDGIEGNDYSYLYADM